MPSRLGCMLTFIEARKACAHDSAGALQARGASSDLGLTNKRSCVQTCVLRRDVLWGSCGIQNAFSICKSGGRTAEGRTVKSLGPDRSARMAGEPAVVVGMGWPRIWEPG